MAYITIESALEIVKKYSEIDENDFSNDPLLIELLDQSRGNTLDGLSPAYRPFIISAYFLSINKDNDGIESMTGTDTIKFASNDKQIQGLLDLQNLLDAKIKDISEAWIPEKDEIHTFSGMIIN